MRGVTQRILSRMVLLLLLGVLPAVAAAAETASRAVPRPNFIIIFTDDQGYGDLGCYGSPDIVTPNIDRLASEGLRFTSFYAAPFCGPSRASLMTGCYAPRVSLAFNHVPQAKTGIHPDEITLGELLQSQGYATMIIGKWHLGDAPQFLPTRNGFDEYYGLPYSNDMWPYHPRMPITDHEDARMTAVRKRATYTGFSGQGTFFEPGQGFHPPLPLISGERVVETNPDLSKLTTAYTDKALEFIGKNKDRPFFLYFAHSMPHVPLAVSDRFKGKSKRGLYGDVIEEIDWSVGQIMSKLKELKLDEQTLVLYTSDNGPWLEYGIDGGSAGPLRGGKSSVYEGGMRVPGIVRWPGRIPADRRQHRSSAHVRAAGGSERSHGSRDRWDGPLAADVGRSRCPQPAQVVLLFRRQQPRGPAASGRHPRRAMEAAPEKGGGRTRGDRVV